MLRPRPRPFQKPEETCNVLAPASCATDISIWCYSEPDNAPEVRGTVIGGERTFTDSRCIRVCRVVADPAHPDDRHRHTW